MIITHLGFPPALINWIMGCISSVSFAILINGSASPIFNIDRGIRQGCPLSPLLFLLVMEGLSRLITTEKRRGGLQGLKIMEHFYLTHLLFVDDILIFLNGSVRDTISLNEILILFCKAMGMEINREKSTISLFECTLQESHLATQNFPFQATDLMEGLKYLGFRLKPDGYKIANWTWLITKVEKRINCWCHRFLSRVGQLTLIKSVLEATPDGLLWKIGNGNSVRIGIDPWTGSDNSHLLPVGLIQHINKQGIKFLGQIGDQQNTTFRTQAWLTDPHWHIPYEWSRFWQNYLQALTKSHVRLWNVEDELIWAHSKAEKYTPKQGYDIIIANKKPEVTRSWWGTIWKLKAPPRTRLLMWNILEDKIAIGSYLKRRAFMGPTWCVLCLQEEEST
eukprot:PITA_28493